MKLAEILQETPLGDFNKIRLGPRQHKDNPMFNFVDSEARLKVAKKNFKTIKQTVNFYFVTGIDFIAVDFPNKIAIKSANPSYYLAVSYEDLVKNIAYTLAEKKVDDTGYDVKDAQMEKLRKMVADKLPQPDKNEVNIFCLESRKHSEPSDRTDWGFVHDFVHNITLTEKSSLKRFDVAEDLCERFLSQINKRRIGSYHMQQYYSFNDFAKDFTALGSGSFIARYSRPEEITTELFTQYIVRGDIIYKLPKEFEKNAQIEKALKKTMTDIEDIFDDILKDLGGKIFVTRFV